ncbi:MAG: LptF/LptG family permease, partial [Flavobacteriales bacterium]|nr:LptF/LptG family permease [Flavobacteriales bacterium]
SILLASIMTLGKLGESNELVAMKAAGMSLFKIMRPLTILMLFVSMGAFYFTNNLWPMANFKLRVLITDIQNTKAGIIFKEGIFYDDIEGYNIRIGSKSEDGQTFFDILIYDYTGLAANPGNAKDPRDLKRVISAKSGNISKDNVHNLLHLNLTDGFIFQEMNKDDIKNSKMPYSRYYFEQATLNIELESFDFERSDEDQYEKEEYLMTISQINIKIDSTILNQNIKQEDWYEFYKNSFSSTRVINDSNYVKPNVPSSLGYYDPLTDADKKLNLTDAISKLESKKQNNISFMKMEEIMAIYKNDLYVKRHEKFTLSYAVIMLFFLGASLGAVIKKGGFGVPVLIAVGLFLVYFLLTRAGQEMASSEALTPAVGMWLSSIILTPITIWIFYKANKDSKIFEFDFYRKLFNRKK